MNSIGAIALFVLGLGHLVFGPVLITTITQVWSGASSVDTAIVMCLAGLGIMSSWIACASILNFNR